MPVNPYGGHQPFAKHNEHALHRPAYYVMQSDVATAGPPPRSEDRLSQARVLR